MSFVASPLANPTTEAVAGRPRSVRRTSHIDMVFDGPIEGGLTLIGRARDLLTDEDGTAHVHDAADVRADLDQTRKLHTLTTDPMEPAAQGLLGLLVGPGFRAEVD